MFSSLILALFADLPKRKNVIFSKYIKTFNEVKISTPRAGLREKTNVV